MVAASSLCPSLQRQGGRLDQGRDDGTRNQKICSVLYEYMSESCSVVPCSFQPHGLVHGILQVRRLEWVAFPFSGASSQPRDRTHVSHIQILYQLSHKGSPRILEWVPIPFPGDLPDPGIELGSPACRRILYQLKALVISLSLGLWALRGPLCQSGCPPACSTGLTLRRLPQVF